MVEESWIGRGCVRVSVQFNVELPVMGDLKCAPEVCHDAQRQPLSAMHLIPYIGRDALSLGPVAARLTSYQKMSGWDAQLWCVDTMDGVVWAESSCGLQRRRVRLFRRLGPKRLAFTPHMERTARSSDGRLISVLHQHGVWTALSRVTIEWRKAHKRPTVITAHGALAGRALAQSKLNKKLALIAYEGENLRRADCLHSLSAEEHANFREFGLLNPVAVIPNGIDEAWLDMAVDPDAFRRSVALAPETRIALYLGRITPIKGLPQLLFAMSELRKQLDPWCLVIAGVEEARHESELKEMVKRLGLSRWVRFSGPLFGRDKRNAYAAAELYVLPSHSEGSPITVLEALGAGVPVLTTKASPWRELTTHGCGWWTEAAVDGIGGALDGILRVPAVELAEMGRRGRSLIRAKYTWSTIAKQTCEMYDWLLGRLPQPEFVHLA